MRLRMSEIRKRFASGEVLHGVAFDLEPGQIHALAGHNGAGKSTLMKILAGVYPDYTGTITLDDRAVSLGAPRDAHRLGIATIYQEFALIPELSVADNIALGREPRGAVPGFLSHRRLRERSAQEARDAGVQLPMATPVSRLGVAEQQLTEIVRALSRQARILIMDEPTARLAPHERNHLFALMRRLAQSGVGIVYISHFLEEIMEVADRVTVLRDGHVVACDQATAFSLERLTQLLVGDTQAGPGAAIPPRPTPGSQANALALQDFSVAGRQPVNLCVAPGEILGFAGLVGSGRTRLARGIIGDVPSRGGILVEGRPLPRNSPRRAARAGVLLVPEDRKVTGLVATASVSDNIALTALGGPLSRLGFVRPRLRRQLVRDALERFHILPPDPERNVATLSGGNAQKVLLARAASARPTVLILDQPTAGVDVGAKAELHRQIRQLAASGVGILLISDDLDELLDNCKRIVVMQAGTATGGYPSEGLDRASLLAAMSRNAEVDAQGEPC